MKITLKQFYAHSQNLKTFFKKRNSTSECNLQDNYHKIKMNINFQKLLKILIV